MKTIRPKHTIIAAFLALLAASLAGLNNVQAQTYIASFDTSISANDSTGGDLAATATTVWDSSVNAPNGPAGGSEYVTLNFANNTGWQEMQLNFTGDQNLASFINVELDIKVDVANSHIGPNGYGALYPVIQNWSGGSPGWGQLTPQFITNNGTGWQHMKFQLIGVASSLNRLVLDINTGGGAVTNTCAYWIDNIALTSAPLPPPTLTTPVPTPKQKGLTFLPATTGQYQRVMVYPNIASPQYGWYGQATAGNPVSYSFTITNFPPVGNYTAQMFWIPISSLKYNQNDTSVDWNCTNDMILTIGASNNSGLATNWTCQLAVKTNGPASGGNPNLTITNFVYNSLPLGTWTITFNNNTDFTITAPDSTSVNASLPPDVASLVSGNDAGNTQVAPYFGIQPNNAQGIGLATVMSGIKITGTASTAINDSFSTGSLDTNTWSILSDEPVDIYVSSGDLIYYVSWNTPNDQGYSTLLAAPTAAGPWNDLVSSSSWMLLNGNKAAQITKSGLQSVTGQSSSAMFKLVKRTFTQLQVLLPGETNAPNTLTGKIGTPTPVSSGSFVTVTVNAVDSTWHQVNAGDTVTITTTDPIAITPNNSSLVNGTTTGIIQFNTAGSWTVTASDFTDNTKTPNTSSPITVQ